MIQAAMDADKRTYSAGEGEQRTEKRTRLSAPDEGRAPLLSDMLFLTWQRWHARTCLPCTQALTARDEKRNRLHCDKVVKLLFIKKNLQLYLKK